MRIDKRPIQINNLVIDSVDMLDSLDFSVATKAQSTPYSYGDGSYLPSRSKQVFVEEQTASMTIRIKLKKVRCNERLQYKDYIVTNLLQNGKLWCVEGTRLLWAYFSLDDYAESKDSSFYDISMNISLTFPEGVWHFANPYTTFLKPYNACDFNICNEYREIDYCKNACSVCGGDCYTPNGDAGCCDCDCDSLDRESSLACIGKNTIQSFYGNCRSSYQVLESCTAGKRIFGDELLRGTKLCAKPLSRFVAGKVYAETVKDTNQVTIVLDGTFTDPTIEFNRNTILLSGSYDGIVTIYPNMEGTYQKKCCDPVPIALENITKQAGSNYEFMAHHGNNSLIVNLGKCGFACVYVKIDNITI